MSAMPVRLVIFDFDGFLTIHRLHQDAGGREYMRMPDSHSIRMALELGLQATFLQ